MIQEIHRCVVCSAEFPDEAGLAAHGPECGKVVPGFEKGGALDRAVDAVIDEPTEYDHAVDTAQKSGDPVACLGEGDWGFWDETWTDWHGGWPDENAARAALERYVIQLEGPVRLIWATPEGDNQIAHLARVSNSKAKPGDPAARLIGFLLRNHHWSPFEMASMCVEINTTRDITNQIIRHRSFSFQEYSTRYADVEELLHAKECRFQDTKNRQNSFTIAEVMESRYPGEDWTLKEEAEEERTVSYFDAVVNESRERSMEAYEELRRRGVAKEVARCILPFGLLPSKIYMTGTVRSWIHYLAERTKPGVQKEHRDVALQVERIFRKAFPLVAEALDQLRIAELRHQRKFVLMEEAIGHARGTVVLDRIDQEAEEWAISQVYPEGEVIAIPMTGPDAVAHDSQS